MAPKRGAAKAPEPANKKHKGSGKGKAAAADSKNASKKAAAPAAKKEKESPVKQVKKKEEEAKSSTEKAAPAVVKPEDSKEEVVAEAAALAEEVQEAPQEPPEPPAPEPEPLTPEEMCESVVEALKASADVVPPNCLEMLVSMVSSCLRPSATERHPYQAAALALLERAMKDIEEELDRTVQHCTDQVSTAVDRGLAETKAEVVSRTEQIEKKRDELIEAKNQVDRGRDRLAEAVKRASTLQEAAQKEQEERDACQAALEFEIPLVKDGVTMFRNGGFVRPDDPQHVEKLQPLLKRIGFEDTLLQALPVAATRALSARGNFDRMVLEQVANRLQEHTATLKAKLEALPTTVAECDAEVHAAQSACTEAESAHQQAAEMLEVMETEKAQLEAAFEERKQQAVREAEEARDKACVALKDFRAGPLTAYLTLEKQGLDILAAEAEAARALIKANEAAAAPPQKETEAPAVTAAAADKEQKSADPAPPPQQQLPTPCRATLEARAA